MQLEFTDVERLILSNQYEILGKLNNNDEYELRLAKQLRDGHKWLYKQSFQHVSENMVDEDARFVLNILEVYQTLKYSYDDLVDTTGIELHDVTFKGFDGNNETDESYFVQCLKEAGRFENTIGENINSHSRMIPRYEAMIQAWKEVGKPYGTTSKENVLAILGKKQPTP